MNAAFHKSPSRMNAVTFSADSKSSAHRLQSLPEENDAEILHISVKAGNSSPPPSETYHTINTCTISAAPLPIPRSSIVRPKTKSTTSQKVAPQFWEMLEMFAIIRHATLLRTPPPGAVRVAHHTSGRYEFFLHRGSGTLLRGLHDCANRT